MASCHTLEATREQARTKIRVVETRVHPHLKLMFSQLKHRDFSMVVRSIPIKAETYADGSESEPTNSYFCEDGLEIDFYSDSPWERDRRLGGI